MLGVKLFSGILYQSVFIPVVYKIFCYLVRTLTCFRDEINDIDNYLICMPKFLMSYLFKEIISDVFVINDALVYCNFGKGRGAR